MNKHTGYTPDRIYAVAAYRSNNSQGWHSTEQLPMFYLHAGTQGIVSEEHACKVAERIVGEPCTAYDVTADTEVFRLAEENERLRALLASWLEEDCEFDRVDTSEWYCNVHKLLMIAPHEPVNCAAVLAGRDSK